METEPREQQPTAAVEPAETTGKPIEEEPKFAKSEVRTIVKEALDEQYKKLNKSLIALGQENKRLRDERLKPSTTDESDTALELMVQREKKRAVEMGEADPEIAKLEELLRLKRVQKEREAQLQRQQKMSDEAWDKINKQITDAGFDSQDKKFEEVIDAFEDARDFTGNFARAQRKLDRLLEKEVVPPKEDEVEIKRKKMEEEGKLKTDTGSFGKGAGFFTRQQIAAMSVKEFAEKRDAIDAAYRAGRVK